MTPNEIAKNYDQIADRWGSDVFPESNGIVQHERAIAFVDQPGRALDVGCGGSGRIIEFLKNHGFNVEGVDLSGACSSSPGNVIRPITFHQADIVTWEFPAAYSLISAWDSVWHVPLADQEAVLRKMLRGLTKGGVCVFTMGGLKNPAS